MENKKKGAQTPFFTINMMNYFKPQMSLNDINRISALGLAHIGDGVYELLTRTYLCTQGHTSVGELHKLTVSYVNAPAQAAAVEKIRSLLNEEEAAVYKRGRNCKVNSVPQHADLSQYHAATGLEMLFGWLYLQGKQERINELFRVIIGDEEE